MSKPNYTHLVLVLDASDSMRGSKNSLIRSTCAFLDAQAKLASELTVSVVIFNHDVTSHYLYFGTPTEASDYVRDQYNCSGGTALYDAVGCTTQTTGQHIATLAEENQPEKIIFAIITDGQENGNSSQHNVTTVKELVNHYEDTYKWEFLYVGSNQNAYRVGKDFGIKAGKALSYAATKDGLEHAMNAVCGAVTRFRENGAPHANEFFNAVDHEYQQALGAVAVPRRSDF